MAMPLVLVIMAALLVLALAAVLLSRESRLASRCWLDQSRARLAVDAGLHEVIAQMRAGMANDDFLIVQSPGLGVQADGCRRVPLLQWMCGREDAGGLAYERTAMFSTTRDLSDLDGSGVLDRADLLSEEAPLASFPVGAGDRVEVEWIPLQDERGQVVADYAYWVEDLQARLDPRWAGNAMGPGGSHQRVAYPLPASAMPAGESYLNQVPLESLLPKSDRDEGVLRMERLVADRDHLDSPESMLWVAGFRPPMQRIRHASPPLAVGDLEDPVARRIELSMISGLQPYDEQQRVPFVDGVDGSCVGMPQMDLNRLLCEDRVVAVDRMASWIEKAMPEFRKRAGGFPDDYLRVLAANALDYADADDLPSGDGLGLDSHPWISEVVLHVHFQGLVNEGGRWVMKWRLRLFAELWNMSNLPIGGGIAQVSFEVNLQPTPVGLGAEGLAFDDRVLLDDARQSSHQLESVSGRYFGPPFQVDLRPDEYRFHEVASVDYTIDCFPQFDAAGRPIVETFDLAEPEEGMRGMTLIWNGVPVHRVPKIVRDPYGLSDFRTDRPRKASKACIPGLNYGAGSEFANNPGDPRMASFFRNLPLGENASPENVSPHRRNVRRRNIYDRDPSPNKSRHYGRVLPSQWPDGGHDSDVGDFLVTTSDAAVPTDPLKWPLELVPEPLVANAPMRISNAGSYGSVVELGRVYDPLMWRPVYPDLPGVPGSGERDTRGLNGYGFVRPQMPDRRQSWPEVSLGSLPSAEHGGGNTLRIGRPEHERFDRAGLRASQWLDLFCAGSETSSLRRIAGHVNLNTADREVLRALVHGAWLQDPGLCRVVDRAHDLGGPLHESTQAWQMTPEEIDAAADRVADAIIANRPFVSLSQLSGLRDANGNVFGSSDGYPDPTSIRWSDSAAEEGFARLFESSTLRSRNFRIWVVGRIAERRAGVRSSRAEVRRVFTVFVDPGPRRSDGSLDPSQLHVRILHERDF